VKEARRKTQFWTHWLRLAMPSAEILRNVTARFRSSYITDDAVGLKEDGRLNELLNIAHRAKDLKIGTQ